MVKFKLLKPRPSLKGGFKRGNDGTYISLGVEDIVYLSPSPYVTESFLKDRVVHFWPSVYNGQVYSDQIDVCLLSLHLQNADHFGKEMHEVLML